MSEPNPQAVSSEGSAQQWASKQKRCQGCSKEGCGDYTGVTPLEVPGQQDRATPSSGLEGQKQQEEREEVLTMGR